MTCSWEMDGLCFLEEPCAHRIYGWECGIARKDQAKEQYNKRARERYITAKRYKTDPEYRARKIKTAKKYQENHKNKTVEYQKKYRLRPDVQERYRQKRKEKYQKNRETIITDRREYRKANKDKINARRREKRRQNPEKQKEINKRTWQKQKAKIAKERGEM
jgi:hypothetical protein